jgi:2-polyprenyl-3-methyl-5-hydroxy-6-metoxy-1,4-benzoquinol methylase
MISAKKIVTNVASFLNIFWRLVPSKMRNRLFLAMFIVESRGKSTENSLRNLFRLEDSLNLVINECSLRYGNGEHPKHSLIPYHQFFIEHLQQAKQVLDVGCGYGAVARTIAKELPHVRVTGIENDLQRFLQAQNHSDNPTNLTFVLTDLYDFRPNQSYDHVVLSNVLEHLENRIQILQELRRLTNAETFLIRVPAFERHWTIPMRKKLQMNYFSDDDHKIEHTLKEFLWEIAAAGLSVSHIETLWGEIWAVCK